MIEIHDVVVRYPGAHAPAIDGVSITLGAGEMVGVLGPNGSGKSTLARLCNALIMPTDGSVTVDGMDTREPASVWDIRSRVGFVQQNPDNQIVGTVVEEDVAFGPENLGVPLPELRNRVDEALALTGLSELARREPHLLSEGQKQRLAIAGALAMRPSYLVLDEPTAMLDGQGRHDVAAILGRLRASGVGILYVSHHLQEVLVADRVVVLDGGRAVFEGTPRSLIEARRLPEGLDLPPVLQLVAALRRHGIEVGPATVDAEAIVEALWPS